MKEIGFSIERDEHFPVGTNVHFVQRVGTSEFFVRHWERGAGETLGCGTGACASVAAAMLSNNEIAADIEFHRCAVIHSPGGDLEINLALDDRLWITGPVRTVFEGTLGWDAVFPTEDSTCQQCVQVKLPAENPSWGTVQIQAV